MHLLALLNRLDTVFLNRPDIIQLFWWYVGLQSLVGSTEGAVGGGQWAVGSGG